MWIRRLVVLLAFVLLAKPGWSKVFLRWSEVEIPPASELGVADLVISRDQINGISLQKARKQGYRVFVEFSPRETSVATEVSATRGLAGIIVKAGEAGAEPRDLGDQLQKLRSAHPELKVLLLGQGGKQPQIKGNLVVKNDGILQVSSPTTKPWIDSNLALIRYERSAHPSQPPLVSFQWEFPGAPAGYGTPTAGDYALAVAEAGASRADVILDVDQNLQRALISKRSRAWETWNQVKRYLQFYSRQGSYELVADVGVVTSDYEASFEPTNLMARHNIPFRVLPPYDLDAGQLQGLAVVVVFSRLDEETKGVLCGFATQGGTVVMAGLQDSYPWHSSQPYTKNQQSATYKVGAGKIIELTETITDPETFAEDVRRLLPKQEVWFRLWNALTTLGVLYRRPGTSDLRLDLVNYLHEPLQIQVRVRGSFTDVRYETPERGCCESLTPAISSGFTQFVVPGLTIGGRVHLKTSGGVH
jgi:hypothetical protein